MNKRLEVGDTIRCVDADELLEMNGIMEKRGYEVDFLYEKDGEKGYWLEIMKIRDVEKEL